jgi:hypothetical protein
LRTAGTRRVHEDASHHLRGHRKKLGARMPFDSCYIDQAEVDLIHQRRRLQRIRVAFVLEMPARQVSIYRIPAQTTAKIILPGTVRWAHSPFVT